MRPTLLPFYVFALSASIPLQVHAAPTITNDEIQLSSQDADQAILQSTSESIRPRKLRGRFLHISDMHPDPHYKVGSSLGTSCHRKKPKKDERSAGWYGTKYSDCDSPFTLTNFTLDYLEKHWASEIDFVVWTGDNARHDNDRKLPRTPAEIYDLNRAVAHRMEEIFTRRGIPVIPSLGNNDIWPHNIMTGGPNTITIEFSSIWKKFIPFPAFQIFQRGAYYSVEVVPDQLAVISLNTIYFYDSNKAVSGCESQVKDDPGNLEFDWLEVQLKRFRSRGMQVYLTGHVPPSPGNYFPECYVRYAELALRFQDTIVGHLYGHMNSDHFSFLEAIDLELEADNKGFRLAKAKKEDTLFEQLIEEFKALPSPKKTDLNNFAVVNTSPPIVPNPYLPTFRIFIYNATGYDTKAITITKDRKHGHHRGRKGDKEKQCKKLPWRESWKCILKEPWYSDPSSPSRMNQLWTPLGYAQFFMPRLEDATKKHKPRFELEYVTFPFTHLHPGVGGGNETVNGTASGNVDGPIPIKLLPEALRDANDTSGCDDYCAYGMEDLTVGSWIELARRLAGDKKKSGKLRKHFRQYMYLGMKN